MTASLSAFKKHLTGDPMRTVMAALNLSLFMTAFLLESPEKVLAGFWTIQLAPCGLITDYMALAGPGAAFFNAGCVMLVGFLLTLVLRLRYTGGTVASLSLMAGFALFGKNALNILPILAGVWLYARYQREKMSRYIYIALFGTCLGPVVSEFAVYAPLPLPLRLIGAVGAGLFIGFILPPIASYTLRIHQGYNLYNIGFAAGIVGLMVMSLSKSIGYAPNTPLLWATGYNVPMAIYLTVVFGAMLAVGFLCNGHKLRGLWRITRHSGRSVADFVAMDGFAVTLMNMGLVGLFSTAYMLAIEGDLNGPTLGGIFTVMGFGAFGKHLKNITPVMLGVVLGSFFKVWTMTTPSVQIAALFCTALAPIAGEYGFIWGLAAGLIHSSVVLCVGALHGGLNLYNNGFSAGLVCIILIPLIEVFQKEKGI